MRSLELPASAYSRLDLAEAIGMLFAEEYDSGLALLLSVLPRLRSHPKRLTASANLALAKAYIKKGLIDEAWSALTTVSLNLPAGDLYSMGMLNGAIGSWWLAKGERAEAAAFFEKGADILAPINPFDSAFLVLNRVETLLTDGKTEQAVRAAAQTIPLVDSLDSNRATAEALKRLQLASVSGKMTLKMLDSIRAKVVDGRHLGLRPSL